MEVLSHAVTALSIVSFSIPTRQFFKNESVNIFNLGPLLPNGEKYWIFIDADMIKNAVDGASQFFVALYFSYTCVGVRAHTA